MGRGTEYVAFGLLFPDCDVALTVEAQLIVAAPVLTPGAAGTLGPVVVARAKEAVCETAGTAIIFDAAAPRALCANVTWNNCLRQFNV
jgi:hypothetical protein